MQGPGVRELVQRFYDQLWNAWDDDAVALFTAANALLTEAWVLGDVDDLHRQLA